MRWSLRLAEFDFDVEHRPGALSRHVQAITLSKNLVRAEQKRDNFCSTLQVGKQKWRSEYFYDVEGFIYRRRKNGEHQLIIPRKLVREVISLNNDPIFTAHPGRKRTLEICVLGTIGKE
jgi:hypothetical protein